MLKFYKFCLFGYFRLQAVKEIGSNTGYISRENKKTLAKLHTFCKKDTKLKHFTRNLSTIAVLSSYYLFNNRNLETWHTPSDFISTPMNIMWIMWNFIFLQTRNHYMPAGRSVLILHFNLSMRTSYYFIELIFVHKQ